MLFELCEELDHDDQSVYEKMMPDHDFVGDINSDNDVE